MPAMPVQLGPASEYAKSRQPLVLTILVVQSLVCVLRMVFLLDIMGGFIMAIMIALGWYAWKEDMNITFICYWGVLCLVNGLFDLVKLIDHTVKSEYGIFNSRLTPYYNFLSGVFLSIPIVTLIGVPISWYLYKNYTDGDDAEPGGAFEAQNRPQPSERQPLLAPALSGARASQSSQFHAFEGAGQRLGD